MERKQIVEDAYGPDPFLVGFWLLLTGIPAFLEIFTFIAQGRVANPVPWLVVLGPPLAVLIFTLRFRACFTADTFVYRRWGKTVRVPYEQIAGIEVTNVTPIAKQPVGASIVTLSGARFPFWPKLFPKAAVARFFALADRTRVMEDAR
jgi:hypothetical protein